MTNELKFYDVWVCIKCEETRNFKMLSSLEPPTCKLCGKKVKAIRIYVNMLPGFTEDVKANTIKWAKENARIDGEKLHSILVQEVLAQKEKGATVGGLQKAIIQAKPIIIKGE